MCIILMIVEIRNNEITLALMRQPLRVPLAYHPEIDRHPILGQIDDTETKNTNKQNSSK